MSSRVKLLPESLINRIAAGEVVERPASILKELLENSLDAGATRIEVDIEAGGKKLIRVSDNGCGLNREELFLCLERHATSKISAESDLFSISTLGFRGEALPSIASVSRMSITSQPEGGEGHRLRVEGGKIVDLSPAATNQGTIVEVRDIFFNVPARRKFLKTETTEMAHLVESAQRYALSRPKLRLRLRDSGREILSVDEHNDMAARALKILGRDVAASLRPFSSQVGDLKIEGFLAGPEAARANSGLFSFVLGRPVRDKLINKAIIQGYGRTLPHGRFPSGVVFVDLDPARVDVNVHPAKTEVRFREPGLVFDTLTKAVSKAIDVSPIASSKLAPGAWPRDQEPPGRQAPWRATRDPVPETHSLSLEAPVAAQVPSPGYLLGRPQKGPIDEANERQPKGSNFLSLGFSMGRPLKRPALGLPERPAVPPWMEEGPGPNEILPRVPEANPVGSRSPQDLSPGQAADPGQANEPALADDGHGPVKALAQFLQSYVLAEGPDALYIIDQHAAHERIIFNSLKESLKKEGLPSQGLILPQTLELGPRENQAILALQESLGHLGFRLEPFGDSTWSLRGIPAMLSPEAAREALLEILTSAMARLRDLDGAGLASAAGELSGTWLYSLACRAAIKAGERLAQEEMESLLRSLANSSTGGFCPHGRPSSIVIKLSDLEKRFGRS
ncbi:MAG: DNA mismatch repair endonuclease MutL [Deltaproteobacteria bacterium]|jgi:DNA mismatch repair protein MutL|nr:DNA mismatch repair endonuclease MutL [Deltaproteobacteria bacterium]